MVSLYCGKHISHRLTTCDNRFMTMSRCMGARSKSAAVKNETQASNMNVYYHSLDTHNTRAQKVFASVIFRE